MKNAYQHMPSMHVCVLQDCVDIEVPNTVLLKAPRASLAARLCNKSDTHTAKRFQFSQVSYIFSGEVHFCFVLGILTPIPHSSLWNSLICVLSLNEIISKYSSHMCCVQVFGPETTQREMFDGTVKGLVRDVLEGENSLVFTYGVTNAGKTFTFLGWAY